MAELNRHWFQPLEAFPGAQITPAQLSEYWTDYHRVVDWREFNIDNLVDQLLWIKGQIETVDTVTPLTSMSRRPRAAQAGRTFGRKNALLISSALRFILPGFSPLLPRIPNTANATLTGST